MKSKNSLIPLIFSLIFFHSAEAICKPRGFHYIQPSSNASTSTTQQQQSPSPSAPAPNQVPSSPSPTSTPISNANSNPPNSEPQPSTSSSSSSSAKTFTPSPSPASPPTSSSRPLAGINLFNQPTPKTEPTTIDPAVKKICDSTDYPTLCLSSLIPFLIVGKTDHVSILESAIKASTQHAKLALEAATKLASAPNLPPRKASGLSDCQYMFNDALDNLESAMDAIPSKDYGTVNSMLSAVVTDSETCEDGFPGQSPLAEFDEKLRMMGSNCLAISSLISPII